MEWWYGNLIHYCIHLLCHATPYETARPLFPLVLAVAQSPHLGFMRRTTNYFGEQPVHLITGRRAGRRNAAFILYRMCMCDGWAYVRTVHAAWVGLRTHAHRRVHARRFRPCLVDLARYATHREGFRSDAFVPTEG